MGFGHEKLDVYRLAIETVGLVYALCRKLRWEHRFAKDQLLRASQSIPLNIAEGNGKASANDRRRYFEIARGSAYECAAILDVLVVCQAIPSEQAPPIKNFLNRISGMLTKLGGRGYTQKR